ncbi:tripeptidyl peptidase A [Aspergillus luchuensis]|uniref:Tripeptidyl peptidase A n=1 Tax=Aspergillus kawachii TaxID=1069201 RepID=A0A146F1U7_ASPKA|nr:tripeptidyl peptidase A [Aspergillus luchuensis]
MLKTERNDTAAYSDMMAYEAIFHHSSHRGYRTE